MLGRRRAHILQFLIGALMLGTVASAHAVSLDSMTVAQALGDLMGSEKYCGLLFNQDAIKKFIDSRVRADDMEFSSMLTVMTTGSQYANERRSLSEKTAHCAQISRVARSYGFIP